MIIKVLRKSVTILSWIFTVLILLYLTILLIIHIPSLQTYIINIAEKQTAKNLKVSLRIADYSTNLLTFINLYNVRIFSSGALRDSAQIDKLHIKFSLFSLPQRKLVIPEIEATGGFLYALRDESGKFRIPVPTIPKKQSKKDNVNQWRVEASRICVRKIDLKYYDSKLGTVITLKELNGCTNLDSLDALFSSQNIKIRTPDWNMTIDTFYVKLRLIDSIIHISSFFLQNAESMLLVKGQLPISPKDSLNLNGYLSTDLKPFSPILIPSQHQISGAINSIFDIRGTLLSPVIKTNITSSSISFHDLSIDTLHLYASYRENDSLRAEVYLNNSYASANLKSSLLLKDLFSKPQFIGYNADLRVNNVDINRVFKLFNLDPISLYNTGSFHLQATGDKLNQLPQNSTLSVKTFNNDPNFVDTAIALFSLNGKKWDLHATLGKNNLIKGTGEIRLNDLFQGSLVASINNLSPLSRHFFKNPFYGSINVNADFSDILTNPKLIIDISSNSVYWRGFRLTNLDGNLKFDKKWDITRMQGLVKADLSNISLPHQLDLSGDLKADFQIKGNLQSPVINSNLSVTNPAYNDLQANLLSANLLYENKRILWDSLILQKDTLILKSTGLVGLLDSGILFETSSAVSVNDLSAIKFSSSGSLIEDSVIVNILLDYAMTGYFKTDIPVLPCTDGRIKFNSLIDNQYCIRHGNISFDLSHISPQLSTTYLSFGSITFDDAKLNGNIRITDINDSISTILILVESQLRQKCFNQFTDFNDGSTVELFVRNFNLGEVLQSVIPDLSYQGNLGGNIKAVTKNNDWQLSGTLSAYADTLFYSPQLISVSKAQIRASLSGSVVNPIIDLSAVAKTASFDQISTSNLYAKVIYSPNIIKIDSLYSLFLNEGYLNIKGIISLSEKSNFLSQADYTLHKVPLNLINPIVPAFHIQEGTVSGKGVFHPESREQNTKGDIFINNLQFYINDCSGIAGPFESSIKLNKDSIIIDTVYGKWGNGIIKGGGFLNGTFNKLNDLNAQFEIQDIRLNCLDALQIGIDNASTLIKTKNGQFQVTVKIQLDDSRIEQNFTIPGLIEGSLESKEGPFLPGPLMQKTTVDASVIIDRNLLIETNLGRFLLDGQINISGPVANPAFNWNLRIEEGSVRYLEHEFNIDNGTINQFSNTQINPELNISATSDVEDLSSPQAPSYTINVNVQGTLNNPVFSITSNPPLEEQQILSLLTLGGIEGGPGLGTRTGQLLGSYVTGLGSQYIENITGLANVSLSGGFLTGDEGLSLSVSENIFPKVSLFYQTKISDFGNYAVMIIYRLLPQIRLSGRTDSQGNSDIGVQFLYRR